MGQILTVEFRGAEHFAFRRSDGIFVALKPIVEAMGLDWSAQLKRVKRDPILDEGMAIMATPFGRGSGQGTACLRLDLLHGWFFTIETTRIPDEGIRTKVQAYQREAYGVLFQAFTGVVDPAVTGIISRPSEPITPTLAVAMVTEARRTFGRAEARLLWRQLGLPSVSGVFGDPEQAELPLTITTPAA